MLLLGFFQSDLPINCLSCPNYVSKSDNVVSRLANFILFSSHGVPHLLFFSVLGLNELKS